MPPEDLERMAHPPGRLGRRVASAARWLAGWSGVLGVLAALSAFNLHPPGGATPPIRGDGLGYHIWTRAFLTADLCFCQFPEVRQAQAISLRHTKRHGCLNKYPPGLALLRFPVMAWLVDLRPGAPLVSDAEHAANQILSALALLAACVLVALTARELGLLTRWTQVAIVAGVFGTGAFHYASFDAFNVHVYGLMLVALWLHWGVRWRSRRLRVASLLALAGTGALLVLLRNTHLIIGVALVAAYWVWLAGSGLGQRTRKAVAVAALSGMFFGLAVQVAYNSSVTGRLELSSYGRERFRFDRPMHPALLFSCEGGLLSYYPLVGAVLAGALSVRRTRAAGAWLAGLTLALAVIYGFWHSWHLGHSFGPRGFVELAPLVVVLFAATLSAAPRRGRALLLALAVLCVYATVGTMLGYWRGTLPHEHALASEYWSHLVGLDSLVGRLLAAGRS